MSLWPRLIATILQGWGLVTLDVMSGAAGLLLLWPGIVEYVGTGHITLHWSRLLAGAFALFSVLQILVFALLLQMVSLWVEHRRLMDREAEDRKGRAAAERSPLLEPLPTGSTC